MLISHKKYNLQNAVQKLMHIIKKYNLAVSTQKSKVMTIKDSDPKRSKIVISNASL